MRIFVAALLASAAFSGPAFGADSKSALKQFGLIGMWSSDCMEELSQPRASRIAFAAPLQGDATATARYNRDGVLVTTVYEIVESTMAENETISIAFHPLTVTNSDGKAASQHDYDNVRIVFQKVGERLEIVGVEFEGLPQTQPNSIFEKCVN